MKIGDLVIHWGTKKIGIITKEVFDPLCGVTNDVFDILWQNGTTGHNVWNYDLELISESRRSSKA
tara:strand:- start:259 stop:453 length:195 start_codon:yes stop_codon:yes gene_type:complete